MRIRGRNEDGGIGEFVELPRIGEDGQPLPPAEPLEQKAARLEADNLALKKKQESDGKRLDATENAIMALMDMGMM
jgi:hypothetical protein